MENPSSSMLGPRLDFKFAFNDTVFSDRVLHIEIIDDSLDPNFDSKGCDIARNTKRKRENSGHEKVCSAVAQVKTLNISSVVLAANSPFFYKLFKNGMRESHQKDDVTLRINASKEAALMELLNFMYNNTLSSTTAPELLGVLIVADKFEVTSCVNYCTELLQNMPMSQESTILYLELDSSVFMGGVVQSLIDAAKQYLVARYNEPYKWSQKDMMALSLCAIEVVFGSDSLKVNSEDDVFIYILNWALSHYPKIEERREILTKRLSRLIRFPYMSTSKLKEALVYADFDHEQVSELILKALLFKCQGPQQHNASLIARPYKYRPVKLVHFECSIRPRCVVYFNITKEECADLLEVQSRLVRSEPFFVGGLCLRLLAGASRNHFTSMYYLSLVVVMEKNIRSASCTSSCEFAVMRKPFEVFQSVYNIYNCPPQDAGVDFVLARRNNMFGVPWPEFMADDSEYFIDGILHLRIQLTINFPQP